MFEQVKGTSDGIHASRDDWLCLDGSNGLTYLPADEFHFTPDQFLAMNESSDFPRSLTECYEGMEMSEVTIVKGYGVRSNAPGYLDCAGWTVYTTKKEALSAYRDEANDCRG